MRSATARGVVFTLMVGLAVVSLLALGTAPPSQADVPCDGTVSAGGCVSRPDHASAFGTCMQLANELCYECQYVCDGGYMEQCWEDPPQTGLHTYCTRCESTCQPFEQY